MSFNEDKLYYNRSTEEIRSFSSDYTSANDWFQAAAPLVNSTIYSTLLD